MKKALLYFSILFFFSSCYYDKEEKLYPAPSCELSGEISFSKDLAPILESKCSSCHDAANASSIGGGLVIVSYTEVKASVEKNGLISSIKQDGSASPMPKNNTKLTSCQISAFESWVFNGMKDN